MNGFEVPIRCGGTILTSSNFPTRKKAKEHIENYNPFDQGMNDDVVFDIKTHGLSFSIWDRSGKCIFIVDKDYLDDGNLVVTEIVFEK